MKELWEAREKPKPLQLAQCLGDGGSADQNGGLDGAHQAATGVSACKALGITGAHRIWSLAECAKVDLQCQAYAWQICSLHAKLCLASVPERCVAPSALCGVFNLHFKKMPLLPSCKTSKICTTKRKIAQVLIESIRQYLEGRPAEIGEAVFDKEDDLAVEFVTAAANLRAANYNIPQQSLFVTKVLPPQHFSLRAAFCCRFFTRLEEESLTPGGLRHKGCVL